LPLGNFHICYHWGCEVANWENAFKKVPNINVCSSKTAYYKLFFVSIKLGFSFRSYKTVEKEEDCLLCIQPMYQKEMVSKKGIKKRINDA